MTLESTTVKSDVYDISTSGGVFPYQFLMWQKEDFRVVVSTDGVDADLDIDDFTVDGLGVETGGNVYYSGSGDYLTIISNRATIQPNDMDNQRAVFLTAVEESLDKTVRSVQQVEESLDRAILKSPIDGRLQEDVRTASEPGYSDSLVPRSYIDQTIFSVLPDGDIVANTIAALIGGTPNDGDMAICYGRDALGDNGGGRLRYDASYDCAANSEKMGVYAYDASTGSDLSLTTQQASTATGAWLRADLAELTPQMAGAKADGVTDDAAALSATVDCAISMGIAFHPPAGVYVYGSRFATITDAIIFRGAGPDKTIFKPKSTYAGYAIRVTECWRNADGSDDPTSTSRNDAVSKTGVELRGFSIEGDRTYTAYGIEFHERNDQVTLADLSFYYLTGSGIRIGESDKSFVRESDFSNIVVHGCGDASNAALHIGTGYLTTASSNQHTWKGLRLVYNQGTALQIDSSKGYGLGESDTTPTQRIRIFGLMAHGTDTALGTPPAKHLVLIKGLVDNVQVYGGQFNGMHTSGGTTYAAVKMEADTDGNNPKRITIHADVRTGSGHAYHVSAVEDCTIQGHIQSNAITGDDLVVDANATTSPIIFDVLGEPGKTVTVDSTVTDHVLALDAADLPVAFGSGNVFFPGGVLEPAVYHGSDLDPNGVVTAPGGSIYISTANTAGVQRSGGKIWIRNGSGTNNNLWQPIQSTLASTATELQDIADEVNVNAPVAGKMVWDTTNLKPVWKKTAAAGGLWVDATGATVHTPS